jgi:hypothetical protein
VAEERINTHRQKIKEYYRDIETRRYQIYEESKK